MKKVLLICHRGSKALERMVDFARVRKLAPIAISSACADGGTAWVEMCNRLEVPYGLSVGSTIDMQDVEALLEREPGEYAFAYANWDGQRELMARMNERFGVRDLTPATVRFVQDKLAFRRALIAEGLSQLHVFPATSPDAQATLQRGGKLIVKPRRGAGSLLTGCVASVPELDRLRALFEAGVPDDDLFSEFVRDNELIAETFFSGTEFSFEIIRSGGKTAFWCIHEKTRMEYTDVTVLERGFCSPCVSIDEAESGAGLAVVEKALDTFGLNNGCFHVEMLRNLEGRWEFIEINARIGGALIGDSVHAQYGRHMLGDWMDLLLHGDVDIPQTAPEFGTYLQFSYAEGERRIGAILESPRMRRPELLRVLVEVGQVCRGDREEFAALCLWKTKRREQAAEIAALAVEEYITLEYEA